MRRTFVLLASIVLFISMLVLGVASQMQAQNTQGQQCSLATLQGPYGAITTGFFQGTLTSPPIFGTASRPFVSVGTVTFDGAGGILPGGEFTASDNGSIGSFSVTGGTYKVNSDCTGSAITLSPSGVGMADLAIVDNGKKILILDTTPGSVQSGFATKIDVQPCSLATLHGTYGTIATGFFQFGATVASQPFAQIGNATADGAGHIDIGQFMFSDNGNISSQPPIPGLTYTVNPDCTGTITFSPSTPPVISFVIVAHGDKILSIQTLPGTVVGSIGIRQ